MSDAIVAGPFRRKLDNRRDNRSEKFIWKPSIEDQDAPSDTELRMHACINWPPPVREIFIRPSRSTGKTGSFAAMYADDVGECLSLLLQHGHTLEQLVARFKPGTLAHAAARAVIKMIKEDR